MGLPFTADQFFGVFALYNRSFGGIAALWWLACVASLGAALWRPREWTGPLVALLAGLWFWNAVAYHALLFTTVNPAAWLFAALFAIEGAVLSWVGLRGAVGSLYPRVPFATAGVALAAYALVYPFLSLALPEPYPRTPTFGVPCPTAILTMGVLLTVRNQPPIAVVVIPVVWSVIGGSAAFLFGVWTDAPLGVAGGLLVADRLMRRRRRRWLERQA